MEVIPDELTFVKKNVLRTFRLIKATMCLHNAIKFEKSVIKNREDSCSYMYHTIKATRGSEYNNETKRKIHY